MDGELERMLSPRVSPSGHESSRSSPGQTGSSRTGCDPPPGPPGRAIGAVATRNVRHGDSRARRRATDRRRGRLSAGRRSAESRRSHRRSSGQRPLRQPAKVDAKRCDLPPPAAADRTRLGIVVARRALFARRLEDGTDPELEELCASSSADEYCRWISQLEMSGPPLACARRWMSAMVARTGSPAGRSTRRMIGSPRAAAAVPPSGAPRPGGRSSRATRSKSLSSMISSKFQLPLEVPGLLWPWLSLYLIAVELDHRRATTFRNARRAGRARPHGSVAPRTRSSPGPSRAGCACPSLRSARPGWAGARRRRAGGSPSRHAG